jgi:uncharacterized protein
MKARRAEGAGLSGDARTEVVERAEERFFELLVDGERAGMVVYEPAGSRYVLTHTVIADEFQGRGLSGVLLRGVLDELRRRGATVTNYCPAAGRFIARHPEYRSLLDPDKPGSLAANPADGGEAGGED